MKAERQNANTQTVLPRSAWVFLILILWKPLLYVVKSRSNANFANINTTITDSFDEPPSIAVKMENSLPILRNAQLIKRRRNIEKNASIWHCKQCGKYDNIIQYLWNSDNQNYISQKGKNSLSYDSRNDAQVKTLFGTKYGSSMIRSWFNSTRKIGHGEFEA